MDGTGCTRRSTVFGPFWYILIHRLMLVLLPIFIAFTGMLQMHGKAAALTKVFLLTGAERVATVTNSILDVNANDIGYRRWRPCTVFGPDC